MSKEKKKKSNTPQEFVNGFTKKKTKKFPDEVAKIEIFRLTI